MRLRRSGYQAFVGFAIAVLVLLLAVGVGALVARWWVLVLAVVPAGIVALAGGPYYADSGPRWLLTLLFYGLPLAVALAVGVAVSRCRSGP